MSARTDALILAGMQFDPTPPSPEETAAIDNLPDDKFRNLLDLAQVLNQSPLFLSFNQETVGERKSVRSRIQQLQDAGMRFSDPLPSEAIDGLDDIQFSQLLDLANTLDRAPLFLAFSDGLQTRPGEEP